MKKAKQKEAKQIDIKKVMSVYSGKAGCCCCGCSGTHTYSSWLTKEAEEDRGYEITPEEINDKTVERIVNKINKSGLNNEYNDTDSYSVTIGNRLYIAYLAPSQ